MRDIKRQKNASKILSARSHKKRRGFSLIEVIVALFVVSVGLVGMISLVFYSTRGESVNRDRLIASQLAQEGVELTRNVREDNWLKGQNWYKGLQDPSCWGCPDHTIKFTIDYQDNQKMVSDIDEGTLQVEEGKYYVHDDSHPDSKFKRMITIESSSNASSSVSSKVQWEDRGETHTYVADTVLYNWR